MLTEQTGCIEHVVALVAEERRPDRHLDLLPFVAVTMEDVQPVEDLYDLDHRQLPKSLVEALVSGDEASREIELGMSDDALCSGPQTPTNVTETDYEMPNTAMPLDPAAERRMGAS